MKRFVIIVGLVLLLVTAFNSLGAFLYRLFPVWGKELVGNVFLNNRTNVDSYGLSRSYFLYETFPYLEHVVIYACWCISVKGIYKILPKILLVFMTYHICQSLLYWYDRNTSISYNIIFLLLLIITLTLIIAKSSKETGIYKRLKPN